MNSSEELRTVARRMVWFKTPPDALRDVSLFLARVTTYGTLDDLISTARYFTEADFEAVLDNPPAGVFDRRSRNYWNRRFHRARGHRCRAGSFGALARTPAAERRRSH